MIKEYVYKGKDLEKILIDNNLKEEDIIKEIETKESKLLKSKTYEVKIIKKEDIIEYLSNYIEEFLKKLCIPCEYKIIEEENIFKIKIDSPKTSIMIGKDGQTIKAIRTILKASLQTQTSINTIISIDVGNYNKDKEEKFLRELKKIIKSVEISKITAELDPMNSYQRRLVHNLVSDSNNLKSRSVGEGMERHIIIEYTEKQD